MLGDVGGLLAQCWDPLGSHIDLIFGENYLPSLHDLLRLHTLLSSLPVLTDRSPFSHRPGGCGPVEPEQDGPYVTVCLLTSSYYLRSV